MSTGKSKTNSKVKPRRLPPARTRSAYFHAYAHKMCSSASPVVRRMSPRAVDALWAACEAFLVELFADSRLAARHAQRDTVSLADMRLACILRGLSRPAC